jgi:hypothetical protein
VADQPPAAVLPEAVFLELVGGADNGPTEELESTARDSMAACL